MFFIHFVKDTHMLLNGWQKRHPHHSLSGGGLDLTLIQGQDQDQGQGQDHLLLQRAALPPFLVLALTLTLVLALVRNIIIFSKVRVLVLNQPKKRSRNGLLVSEKKNRRHESA